MNGKGLSAAEGAELVQCSVTLKSSLWTQQLSPLQHIDHTNFLYPQHWGFTAGAVCSNTPVFSEIPAKESLWSLVSHINTKVFESSAAYATSALQTG